MSQVLWGVGEARMSDGDAMVAVAAAEAVETRLRGTTNDVRLAHRIPQAFRHAITDASAEPLTANINELLNQRLQNMCRGTKQCSEVPLRRRAGIFHLRGTAGPNVCELTPDQWRPGPD